MIHFKASSINNLTDGRYYAAAGCEWMGFSFDQNQVELTTAGEIMGWLAGPRYVAEMSELDYNKINEIFAQSSIDILQLNSIPDYEKLPKQIGALMLEVDLTTFETAASLSAYLSQSKGRIGQYILNCGEQSLAAIKYLSFADWNQLISEYPILIQANFDPEDFQKEMEAIKPLGIVLAGQNELSLGMQAYDQHDEILEKLEAVNLKLES